jgi:hypothetical protein
MIDGPPAAALAGTQVCVRTGRNRRKSSFGYGLMRLPSKIVMNLLLISLLSAAALLLPVSGWAQGAPAAGADAGETPAQPAAVPEWRRTTGYPFPALARTVADMQNLAHAMQLRDYCADARVADDFVRDRLARFSRLTGREETCITLLDY